MIDRTFFVASLALLLAAPACDEPEHQLHVDLRTDIVAAVEFDTVQLEIGGLRSTYRADGNADYIRGVRLDSLALPTEEVTLRMTLERGGQEVASRFLIIVVSSVSQVATIVISRKCRDLECPVTRTCLAGECVDPHCSPETPDLCPAAECASAENCREGLPACAAPVCSSGICLSQSDSRLCAVDQYCDGTLGCRARAVAVFDAGPDDAGRPPDTRLDSGPDVPGACLPGTFVGSGGVCVACPSGQFSDELNAASCAPWTVCSGGAYERVPPAAHMDRVCAACSPIANCVSGSSCTGASDATCDICATGYVPQRGGTRCWAPWLRQFGSPGDDVLTSVVVDDDGAVYVAGHTRGTIGDSSGGREDAFIRKYDWNGDLLWTRQFGTNQIDEAASITLNPRGGVYVAGATRGALEGSSFGTQDAFVRKYDAAGSLLWGRQWGTSVGDSASAVAADASGNVFVAGTTGGSLEGTRVGLRDVFIRKYNGDGVVTWTRQFGTTSEDLGFAIATDARGDVYVAGTTLGALGGTNAGDWDGFVRKYDAAGVVVWSRQFGTTQDDDAKGIIVSGGFLYVVGATTGALAPPSVGAQDVAVVKYSLDGDLLWTRQFGTTASDFGTGVTVDLAGNVYATGYTFGSFGEPGLGGGDAVIQKYAPDGTPLWSRHIGSPSRDQGFGIASDGAGGVFVVGSTRGTWATQTSAGAVDAFVAHAAP